MKSKDEKWWHRLKLIYGIALAFIALTLVSSSLMMQHAIQQNADDARTINLSGRQRMLSQRLTKCILALERATTAEEHTRHLLELSESLASWKTVHLGLQKGDEEQGLPMRENSVEIKALFAEMEPFHAAMVRALDAILRLTDEGRWTLADNRSAADVMLANESRYLALMDKITFQLDREAKARISALQRLEMVILVAGLLVIALEFLCVFRPTLMQVTEMLTALEQKGAQLKESNAKLLELDRLKSLFIASMSHELRTPLNAIIGFTGILLQGLVGELNPKQQEHLERAQKSGQHLLALINDVIDISKIEAGRLEVVTSEFALDKVVGEAVDSIRIQAGGKGLNLQVELPEGVILVSDRRRLLQCLLNFLSNALKFTERGGITVTAREMEDDIEIVVSDTGIGIAEEDLPKLFQAFERIESRLRIRAGGAGLGLYLTRKIAGELLGGGVAVESRPGQGSSFRLRVSRKLAMPNDQ